MMPVFEMAAGNKFSDEPVAWRCKDYADGWIIYQDEGAARRYQSETGCLMQDLHFIIKTTP